MANIIIKSYKGYESDADMVVSMGELRDIASRLIEYAMTLYSQLEAGGLFKTSGKLTRTMGKNARIDVDKEISDIIKSERSVFNKFIILREIRSPDLKLRIICRILSNRTVRIEVGSSYNDDFMSLLSERLSFF